jgi:hypothetical protein
MDSPLELRIEGSGEDLMGVVLPEAERLVVRPASRKRAIARVELLVRAARAQQLSATIAPIDRRKLDPWTNFCGIHHL